MRPENADLKKLIYCSKGVWIVIQGDCMKEIEGMRDAFKHAKIVNLTTFSNKEEKSRPMTNFNDDPYEVIWFPTDKNTRKVEDIKKNPKVLITFPSSKKCEYFEIEGKAEFEKEAVVAEKWQWWYLYWHPEQKDRFWFPTDEHVANRAIINVYPISARVVKKRK